MAISIKDPEVDRLAREVAQRAGESLTGAVKQSLRERLLRLKRYEDDTHLADKIMSIAKRAASRSVVDDRNANDILGYDENGLPR